MSSAAIAANTLSPSTQRPQRKLQIAPGMHVALLPDFLTPLKPKTQLGTVALQVAEQTAISTLSIAAISGYVYALTQASSPLVTFDGVPPGMDNDQLSALQGAYQTFQTQLALFQGQAAAWINTQQGAAAASIFSQMVSVPNTLNAIDGIVTQNFTLLSALPSSLALYQSTLNDQETLIGATKPTITSLVAQIKTLGSNLDNAAKQLIASTETGVLRQMLDAYSDDITFLKSNISNAENQIHHDNLEIIGLGFAAAASIYVGIIGLFNFWNPIGWLMMGGGAVGAYFAITDIEKLKAKIAELKGRIQNDIASAKADKQAAMTLSAFCTQLQGFASMNTAAQTELAALENLYKTLARDITAAVNDLSADQLAEAKHEWDTILQAAKVLSDLTAYIWPTSIQLSAPSSFAAVGSDIYYVSMSGEMYRYAGSSGTWTDMGVTGLSCVAQGSTVIAIDGAPIDGSAINPNPHASTFYVKQYDTSSGTWTTISAFPAAAIATGGGSIYAISQVVSDRQVYLYSGSGTAWSALPQLPGPDAALQIAVAGGTLFALSANSQLVYQYNASIGSWTPVFAQTCASITANGNKLGIIGTNLYAYLYDPANGQTPVNYGTGVTQMAQLADGNDYRTRAKQDLWFANVGANPPTYTQVARNVTGVYASDTGQVYYLDNRGNVFLIHSPGAVPQPLPGITS